MPVDYTIDKSLRMVFSKAHGIMTDEEIYAHQEKLRDDPDFDPGFWQLADCTRVTKADDLSTDAIYELARRNPFGEGSKRAFIAPKKLLFGLLRMFQILTEDYPDELLVCKDMAEAHMYLKLKT